MRILTSIVTALPLAFAALTHGLRADIVIPGADGSDGALNITQNTEIDLSRAVPGIWNSENSANAGKGVYDSNKWAVVFRYSSVNVSAGATVTFINHPSRAPVVWLVGGNVTIEGTVSVDGGVGTQATSPTSHLSEPGPGGFRGGPGYFSPGLGSAAGFGPGGGQYSPASSDNGRGRGASYGTVGSEGPSPYGNPSLLPLVGGSGGAGYNGDSSSGGAGGGAILIACKGSLILSGTIRANGGPGINQWFGPASGGGSGGGIRLVANNIGGNGGLECVGGAGGYSGGLGRIRLERVSESATWAINPGASIVKLTDGATPLIWLPDTGPTVRIVSVGGQAAASDPRASFGTYGPDVTLPQVNTIPVVVETTIAEEASTVTVRVSPRANGRYTETVAQLTEIVSANPLKIRWTAEVPVNAGYSAMQVKLVRP